MPRPKGSQNRIVPTPPQVKIDNVEKKDPPVEKETQPVEYKYVEKKTEYDILFIPVSAFEERKTGKLFKDVHYEKIFNDMIKDGFKPVPIGSNRDRIAFWFQK